MYDTIIVFDRIRENVPADAARGLLADRQPLDERGPDRSLITGLSTVFLIGVLLVFGGETLRDFAFAMMVGVASGTYSSIFIASPVLTEWKEREPAYRSRRARISEAMGYVPTFPEDNVVARIDEVERHVGERGERRRRAAAAPRRRRRRRLDGPGRGRRAAGRARRRGRADARGGGRRRRRAPGDRRRAHPGSRRRERSSRGAGASTGGAGSGGARLVHDRGRALALHGLRPRPLLGAGSSAPCSAPPPAR